VYEDIVRAHASRDVSHILVKSDILPRRDFPVVFHGIRGQELRKKNSPSYLNILETSVVREYCQKLTQDRDYRIGERLASLHLIDLLDPGRRCGGDRCYRTL